MGNDNRGVRLGVLRRLPGENVELIQSSSSGGEAFSRFLADLPKRSSTLSHSGSSGRWSTIGKTTVLNFLSSLNRLITQVSLSNWWMVTSALGGHSGGITKRRRSSRLA